MVLEANSSYALSSMKPEKQNKVYQYGRMKFGATGQK
jgi:hypothetical protein